MDNYLTVPEMEIELYGKGFEGVCQLGREKDGEKLSELVEKLSTPTVIALDAPWGAGKTVFLKCWSGAHKSENNGTAEIIYFDAFKDDFLDDPLIGLISAISERLKDNEDKEKIWEKAKAAALKVMPSIARVALAAATSGVSEVIGPTLTGATNATAEEIKKLSDQFWEQEDDRKAAMTSFRSALEELAKEQKLVIIVDELDRCRPDYALDMLEVMKHFFKVEGIHFILGVNLKQLANSVRARYGEAVEGERYLQKFISITMPLVPPIRQHYGSAHIPIQHFRQVSGQLGLTKSWKFGRLEDYLGFVDHHLGLSLRDVEKIATLAMITPDNIVNSKMGRALQASLLIIKVLAPETLEKARLGQMTRDDLLAIFQLQNPPEQDAADEEKVLFDVWSLIVHPHDQKMTPGQSDQVNDYFRGEKPREYLRDLIAKSLDVFQLPMKTSTAS